LYHDPLAAAESIRCRFFIGRWRSIVSEFISMIVIVLLAMCAGIPATMLVARIAKRERTAARIEAERNAAYERWLMQ
jgi:hypothetical protein